MSQLFARKPIDALQAVDDGHSLKRALGAGDLVMLAIGAVIGAGIFSSIGTAAAGEVRPDGEVIRAAAGPALILSFILLGAVCALAALCYAELASMIPQAGSAYAYSYATLGELVAWIIGWDLILEYAFSNMSVAVGFSAYFNDILDNLFGFHLPTELSRPVIVEGQFTGSWFNLPALLILLFLSYILVRGVRESAENRRRQLRPFAEALPRSPRCRE